MATPYTPKQLLQLLKLCSWQSENPLTFTGFSALENSIATHQVKTGKKDRPSISQKYLNDLLLDVEKKMESVETVGRNAEYIHEITDYVGFKDWKTFEAKLANINGYIDTAKFDLTAFDELKIALFCHYRLEEKIQTPLSYPGKTLEINLTLEKTPENQADSILNQVSNLLASYPFVIWIIDNEWNEILKPIKDSEIINQLLTSGRVIPIRIGETLFEQELEGNITPKKHIVSGKTGLLMALLAIENATQSAVEPEKKIHAKALGANTKIDTLNNSGNLFLGENKLNITGENVALGNFIQNIHKKED